MTSKARNLARLIVDGNGDVDSSALSNVPPSNDASALTTGTLPAARIGDASIASSKLASGAAASNLGSYVTSVNGSTGAVTVSAGMSVDTNTASSATDYAVGTYQMAMQNTTAFLLNSTQTVQRANVAGNQTCCVTTSSGIAATTLSGTWRARGGFQADGIAMSAISTGNSNFTNGKVFLCQRVA